LVYFIIFEMTLIVLRAALNTIGCIMIAMLLIGLLCHWAGVKFGSWVFDGIIEGIE